MVQQSVLLRELSETIRKQDRLAGRLCGLIFLIRKLPRTSGADCGVRATPEMLADLLVSDLTNDGTKLRKEVPLVLQKLVDEGIILKDGEEYNLQTKESQEWDKEFRNRQTQTGSNESVVHQKRDALLQAALQKEINTVRLKQGVSNEPRELVLHFAPEPPDATGQNVPVWVRNEWNVSQKNVVDAARAAGTDSPILFVFVPKAAAEELRQQIIRAEAACGTIGGKGVPSTREGEEARSSMGTRLSDAERARDQLIAQIAGGAKVYKGGGTELFNLTLAEKVREGATDALARLFPRFGEADHKAWTSVINRARNGDDSPLHAVNYEGATEQHPVCKEILGKVGSGIEGRELRKLGQGAPHTLRPHPNRPHGRDSCSPGEPWTLNPGIRAVPAIGQLERGLQRIHASHLQAPRAPRQRHRRLPPQAQCDARFVPVSLELPRQVRLRPHSPRQFLRHQPLDPCLLTLLQLRPVVMRPASFAHLCQQVLSKRLLPQTPTRPLSAAALRQGWARSKLPCSLLTTPPRCGNTNCQLPEPPRVLMFEA